jgi:hypothetical protein
MIRVFQRHCNFSSNSHNKPRPDWFDREKIFDSFFSGCVPVYWGDPQINLYIDENCFIDKRDFMSLEDLYLYLKNMPEKEYIDKQLAIKNFLNSNKFRMVQFLVFRCKELPILSKPLLGTSL